MGLPPSRSRPSRGDGTRRRGRRRGRRERPLGAARAQLHENYIVAQTDGGMVIVDQHAAHERLVYERLKRQMDETGVARQALLIPEIVSSGRCRNAAGAMAEQLARSAS
jgi:DNA mismatch repair protein MutL